MNLYDSILEIEPKFTKSFSKKGNKDQKYFYSSNILNLLIKKRNWYVW